MCTTFYIDIAKNERNSYRSLGLIAYAFIAFFTIIGATLLVLHLRKGSSAAGFLTAICPLFLAVSIYLQLTGQFPYRKFFQVDLEKVQYRTLPFSTVTLEWTAIKSVEAQYSKVIFIIAGGKKTTFHLDKITIQQTSELKRVLRAICAEKQINYQAVGQRDMDQRSMQMYTAD